MRSSSAPVPRFIAASLIASSFMPNLLNMDVKLSRVVAPIYRKPGTYTVFCDESGFTGNNLLDAQQPTFVYAAVAIEAEEAKALLNVVHAQMALPISEIKSSTLLGSIKGRKALMEVLKS